MAIQTYECPVHGIWETNISMCEDVPKELLCTEDVPEDVPEDDAGVDTCYHLSPWRPGTGVSFTIK